MHPSDWVYFRRVHYFGFLFDSRLGSGLIFQAGSVSDSRLSPWLQPGFNPLWVQFGFIPA